VMIGCKHIPFMGTSSKKSTEVAKPGQQEYAPLESGAFVVKGRIIDKQRLRRVQNIVVIPFSAGPGVEASEKLDKAALMIIRGISDSFDKDERRRERHFSVLTAGDSQESDLIIKGHITAMKAPSKIKRWVLLKGEKRLGVEGKMIAPDTGEAIIIFTDHAETSAKEEDYRLLGYRIGRNIGRFILYGVE
jgi:hypothetical protein